MARLLRYLKCWFHVFSLAFLSYFISQDNLNPIMQKKLSRYLPDLKHILIWSTLPGLKTYGQKPLIARNCQSYNCYLTTDRNLFSDLRYFDGIIFNLQEVNKGSQDLPKVRSKHQKYIFAANDSADNYPVCDPVYDKFFNWTWTYKTNSTIPYRFITIYNADNQELGNDFHWGNMRPLKPEAMRNEYSSKHIAAAIFLDKCTTRSNREVFLNNLVMHLRQFNMTVDVFGKCGTKKCRNIKTSMNACLWKLKKYYFFYLAFEDSLSDDFLTKTVLYAYKNNVVPVVYGNADYQRYLPPGSYIDGRSLGEAKLALTMYQIAYDPHRYTQFFKWKSYYTVEDAKVLDPCSLCLAMNNPNWLLYRITFSNFREWWNKDFKKRCEELSPSLKRSFFFF